MKLSKVVLSLAVVFTFVASTAQAQDKRNFNHNAISKAQLQHRVNNARLEHEQAKLRRADARASLKLANEARKQANT